ncbi:hypothetical protein [Massilia phyllosphaerae]|uniref:hypothetical protein n=1 Tax=Massilia phyllosphaerae TaxID=3106034 RepID=UPI002B1CBF35|nr:hypothetical protein [Massilia sp. SGZ-792]
MTISDEQYAAWLDDSTAQRVTLYRVGCVSGGVQVTRRLSNRHFTGSAAAPYSAVIAKDLEIARSISMDGDAKLSAGDVEVWNVSGELDSWFADVWANQRVEVYVGDARWEEADFRLSFVGNLADIAYGADGKTAVLKFRDALQRLNTPLSEAKFADGTLIPGAFGEVPNVTPVYDRVTGRYYYHWAAAEGLIEPRNDGVPRTVDVTDEPTNGRFSFNANTVGTITCSAQGDKTGGIYRNRIAQLVQLFATQYGKESTRMTADDIDTLNLTLFDAANQQPVGLAILDRTNVLTAMALIASSKGAQVIPSMLGKLRLIQYAIPAAASLSIPRSMQVQDSLAPVARSTVAAAVQIRYCRNYTVQPNLQTSPPPEHRQMFATEWRSYTAVDAATQAAYRLYADPAPIDTCLLTPADAQAEAERRLAIVKVPRTTYRVELTPAGMLVELGEARNLFSDRFGLDAGKPGLVTSLTTNFGNYAVTAELTV